MTEDVSVETANRDGMLASQATMLSFSALPVLLAEEQDIKAARLIITRPAIVVCKNNFTYLFFEAPN
jgi:hypothetical protein